MPATPELYNKELHLDDIAKVVETQARLEDTLYAHVRLARKSGASWQEIADQLGVTRQAAHTRWSKRVEA